MKSCAESFPSLPTKHAVATSIISKRWRPLWHSVPTLHFRDEAFPNRTSFIHFVDAVLLSRDTSFPVRSFRPKCRCPDITAWIHAAVQRGVDSLELEIPLGCSPGIKLPSTVLNCRTLTALTLKEMRLGYVPCVDLPRLKTLRLDMVYFDCRGSVLRLLSGCPVLEDLQAIRLCFMNNQNRENDGEVKCLLNLLRAHVSALHLLLTLFRGVEFLRVFPLRSCASRNPYFYEDNWEDPEVVPECVSSQLRTCSFRNYGGLECELQFARYIMQNSRFL